MERTVERKNSNGSLYLLKLNKYEKKYKTYILDAILSVDDSSLFRRKP